MRNQTLTVVNGKAYTRAGVYYRKTYPLTRASAVRIARLTRSPEYKVTLILDFGGTEVYPVVYRANFTARHSSCPVCNGTGKVTESDSMERMIRTDCPNCR